MKTRGKMRKVLIILVILLAPIVYSQDCNTKCIEASFSSGTCSTTCDSTWIAGANDCAKVGEAFLVIGSESVETYANQDPFIGSNSTDPDWTWIIKNMRTKAATNILDTDDDTQHTGPLLGIKNDFIATDIDSTDVKAKKEGESFCLPNSAICIKFKSLTVSSYATYTIQKTTVDLSSFDTGWTNKITILINSADDASGLVIQTAGFDDPVSGASGSTTDNIWIIYNDTGSYAGIFYEDSSNAKALAGYINMNDPNDDINIADINYQQTQNDNIQIDLRGNFTTANNLDLVLDIIGNEGSVSTDGNDDITINLKHNADSDFDGFGASSGVAEDIDQVWASTNIGTKDEDHRTRYGIIIRNPKTNNAADKLEIEVPADQVKAEIEISRKKSSIIEIESEPTTVLGEQMPSALLSSEVLIKDDFNLIYVGGPCANPDVAEFAEFPSCNDWPLEPGEAMIKYAKNKNNIALLVAGTTARDTKMAAEFLKNYEEYSKLEGTYIIIKNNEPKVLDASFGGIDFSDYPVPFIKEGSFRNMLLVVGDNSKAIDTIGAQDIASSLFSVIRRGITLSNVTIDANKSTIKTEEIPLGNNLGDDTFFGKSLSQADIKTLVDDKLFFGGAKLAYREVLLLYNGGPSIETSLTSSDDLYTSNVYMEATAGSIRYYFVFKEIIEIKAATAGSPLTINILENELSITDAETATQFKSQSAAEYFMRVGDVVTVENKDVELVDIDRSGSIIVKINNTEEIILKDKYDFLEGLKVKNVETFDTEGAKCCCTDLLKGLF